MIKAVIFDMYETLITLYGSPVYFSRQMAEDVGISEDIFTPMWRMTEDDRTTGKVTVDEVVERILRENNCYSEEKVRLVMEKKICYKKEAFEHMHPEIILMMRALKEHGIKIGLISNCHSEESTVIKESVLYPYFDAVCLSYDEGIKKPDLEIFKRCLEKICLNANECLYVGDGGSNELAAAKNVGMKPAQAVWYLKEGSMQPVGRLKEFVNIEAPLGVIDFVHKNNEE